MSDFHVMTTKGGVTFTPLCIEDVVDVVREEMGSEVADCISEVVSDREEGSEYEAMKFNSDFTAMEGEVELYRDMLFEVKSQIEQVMCYIDNKQRINRDKIYIMLEQMDDNITKQL